MADYCSFKGDFQAIVDGYKDNMFTLYGAKRHHVSADTITAIKNTLLARPIVIVFICYSAKL